VTERLKPFHFYRYVQSDFEQWGVVFQNGLLLCVAFSTDGALWFSDTVEGKRRTSLAGITFTQGASTKGIDFCLLWVVFSIQWGVK
jgi:hypothetical protein